MSEPTPGAPTPDEMRARLRPIVVSAAKMDELTSTRTRLGIDAPLLFHHIAGELVLAWCLDWPEVRAYVDADVLAALELDRKGLVKRAHTNFLADVRTGFSSEPAGGLALHTVRAGKAPRDLTSSTLVIDRFWTALSESFGDAPLVVAAPVRELLVACSAADEDAVMALAWIVEDAWGNGAPDDRLSQQLMLWDDGWSLLDDVEDDEEAGHT